MRLSPYADKLQATREPKALTILSLTVILAVAAYLPLVALFSL